MDPHRSCMKQTTQAALAALALFTVSPASANPITYAVAIFEQNANGTLGIGGSITTDGTLGSVNRFNIIDWDLIGSVLTPSGATIFALTGPLSGGPNSLILSMQSVEATPL